MKVGSDVIDDIRRAAIFREEIGWDNFLVRDTGSYGEDHTDLDTSFASLKSFIPQPMNKIKVCVQYRSVEIHLYCASSLVFDSNFSLLNTENLFLSMAVLIL